MTDTDERRERYATAIDGVSLWRAADAAMAVADEELSDALTEYAEDAQQRAFQAEENAGRLAAARSESARLRARLQAVTDETVANVVGPNIDLLCAEIAKLRATIARAESYAHELRHKDAKGLLAALDGPEAGQ